MPWSEQQEAIFRWFGGERQKQHLVVRARAGTGKTTTIIEALNHIQWTIGAGERGLVCAYNKRIAEELTTRLARVQKIDAKTLHSLGYALLRSSWGNGYKMDDRIERERVDKAIPLFGRKPYIWECITSTVKLVQFAKSAAPFADIDVLEDIAGRRGLDHADPTGEWDARWMANVAHHALELSRTPDPAFRISFDDMIYVPAVLGMGASLYDWIIVDEAQDMSAAQLMVAKSALRENGHMVIVGDDRQAIYGFRGADTGCIDRLKKELDAEELGLNTTYRCPKSVVAVAAKLVRDFVCPEEAPDGQVLTGTRNDVLEKARPGDAILSRTNAPLVPLCLAFIRKQVPAKIEGRDIGKMLIERAKSKSLKSDTVEEFIEKLAKWSAKAVSRALASGKAVEEKLANIEDVKETLEAIAESCDTMDDFYEKCDNLFADVDQNGTKQFVVLSTVHKAKGLEWDRVFILRHTLYCNGARRDDPEEKNIHYVAVTRSKSALMMVGESEIDDGEEDDHGQEDTEA